MKNKKVIIAVILGIGAVISLIYGIAAPTKSGKKATPTSDTIFTNETISPQRNIMPSKRHAAKTNFNFWGRNPFAPEQATAEAAAKLVLNGIMWDEKKPLAIINNEVVEIGSKIGEYAVVGINKDSVILNDGTGDLELRLAQ